MGNDNYFDRLLLHLQRQYSKNETVNLQKQKIQELEQLLSESNFKIGEFKSEVSELECKIKKLDNHLNEQILNNQNIRKSQSNFDKQLNKRLSDQKSKVKKHQKDVIFWQDKYYSIKAKQENNE